MRRPFASLALFMVLLSAVTSFAQTAPEPAAPARGGRAGRGAGRAGTPAAGGAATPSTPAPTQSTFKFTLGNVMNPAGLTVVSADTLYTPGKYGFDMNTHPMGYEGDAIGVHAGGPIAFSVDVPEGNYKVTVTVGGPQEATTTLLAESRRLMIEKVHTAAGKTATVDFIVNVRNAHLPPPPTNAPGGSEVRLNNLDNPLTWDDKLSLEFTGANPSIQTIQIEPVTVPTVFIMGDSTVTDQPRDPGASWGQMLPVFFKDTVAIANHATSGETMKSSITGLRLDKVLSQMKRGDYLLMQYGHNDEKQSWPQTYVEPETTFKAYIGVFIAEARRRGATPVIISPMERRPGTTPDPNANSHGSFPRAYQEVAAEQKVAFIDLWSQSKILYAAMGPDVSAAFNDQTHHKTYGAYEISRIIATGIRQNHLPLARELRDDFKDFDPAHPDTAASFTTPINISGSGRPPQGN